MPDKQKNKRPGTKKPAGPPGSKKPVGPPKAKKPAGPPGAKKPSMPPGAVSGGDGADSLSRKDFSSDQDVRWCPGCGDYAILATVQRLMPELDVPKENIVFLSGIGCSGRFPYYMDTYGFHSIHGRAPAFATGLKSSRPELDVWVVTGDGDALSIGGNHLIHVLRRNVDLQILLFNNQIYGLTKGQYSPTSEQGKITKSSPYGSIDHPFNPVAVALGADASFVARTMDRDPKHLKAMMKRAHAHGGAALVEIYQNCNIFNDGAFFAFTERASKAKEALFLEHGQPLLYHNGDRGIRLDGLKLTSVSLKDGQWSADDCLVYDETSQEMAQLMGRMVWQDDLPRPFGVFYREERATYDDLLHTQIDGLVERRGSGDLETLFHDAPIPCALSPQRRRPPIPPLTLLLMSASSSSPDPSPSGMFGLDAYEPDQIAERVLKAGVKKTRFRAYKTLVLGFMGGCFISFGAMYELFILSHPEIGGGTSAILGPLFYAVGYIIAFISGAEIFTTNNLSAMALASGKVSFVEVARNWSLVLFSNLLGAAGIVVLFYFSGIATIHDGALIETAKSISAFKLSYSPMQTIIIGIFGNMLICSGLWLAMAGRSVTDKFIALLVPVAAVPAMNFQHSTGNMFQFFLALITEVDGVALDLPAQLTVATITTNLLLVSIGNIIGGGLFIATIYYFVFLRYKDKDIEVSS